MKNFSNIFKSTKIICVAVIAMFILSGCSNSNNTEKQNITQKNEKMQKIETELSEETSQQTAKTDHDFSQEIETELSEETSQQTAKTDHDLSEEPVETPVQEVNSEPKIIETDWSQYFDGLSGAAVVYDASDNKYTIYNRELAQTQRSPCSTFKIISSLTLCSKKSPTSKVGNELRPHHT